MTYAIVISMLMTRTRKSPASILTVNDRVGRRDCDS